MDTEDIVQHTLVRTLQHLKSFDPRGTGAFQAYLRQAVLNRIRDEVRRIGRKPPTEDTLSEIIDPGPSPIEIAIGREEFDRYESALGELRDSDREAIIARLEFGLSYREAADYLGNPSPDAAKIAVRRAVVRLAEKMSESME